MQNILGPFGDEAVAALIASILSAIIAYWLHQKSKQKANIIFCQQQSNVGLIRSELAEVLPFSYGDEVLENPRLIHMVLTNIGSTVIKQPSITFEVGNSTKMLKPRFQIKPERELKFSDVVKNSPHSVTIKLDYLNPSNPHKEVLMVDLICDGNVEDIKVLGSGEGWSVKYKALQEALRLAFLYAIFGFLILTVSAVIFIIILIKSILNDTVVLQKLSSIWYNYSSVRQSAFVLIGSIALFLILALVAERKSGLPLYRSVFYFIPKSLIRYVINVISKNR